MPVDHEPVPTGAISKRTVATPEPVPPSEIVAANVSFFVVEALLPRLQARIVVTSGYLEGDEPELGPYVRRERHTLGGWAADVLQRAQ